MDKLRLVPMRRCPSCDALIFLNPATEETVYTCTCLELEPTIVYGKDHATEGLQPV